MCMVMYISLESVDYITSRNGIIEVYGNTFPKFRIIIVRYSTNICQAKFHCIIVISIFYSCMYNHGEQKKDGCKIIIIILCKDCC